jgi:hypothetical protein
MDTENAKLRAEVGRLGKLLRTVTTTLAVRQDKDGREDGLLRMLRAAQPAPEKPALPPRVEIQTGPKDMPRAIAPVPSSELRLTPHGRIIHEKNTIDVSGFPYPPETLDNEPVDEQSK